MSMQLPTFKNFGEIIRASAANDPDQIAVIHGQTRRTYRQMEERSNRVASALKKAGIQPGDKVALLSPNCAEYFEIAFGCAKLGAVTVKLNWRLAPKELFHLIDINDTKLLIYHGEKTQWDARLYAEEHTHPAPFQLIDLGGGAEEGVTGYEEFLAQGEAEFPVLFAGGEAPLMHLHTSGTTGFPKCVVYSHERFIQKVAAIAQAMAFDSSMINQSMNQLFHSACAGIYAYLYVGARVILFDRFDPQAYLRTIEREGSTNIGAVPTVIYNLLHQPNIDEFDLHTLKGIGYGAAPMPPSLIDAVLERFPGCELRQSYGTTEMSGPMSFLSPEDHLSDGGAHLYSVGKPLPGVSFRIVDEEGRECPTGTIGEIVAKGCGMMLEYWKQPEETEKAIVDGWYHTRDFGYLDEKGFLTIAGRKNDLIITGGENVFPAEVEAAVGVHPDVDSVCAFGLPDPKWGESIMACVIRREGSTLTEEELRAYCHEHIAGFKVPKRFAFVEELPHNATGKIDRAALIRKYS